MDRIASVLYVVSCAVSLLSAKIGFTAVPTGERYRYLPGYIASMVPVVFDSILRLQ
jgi:hypothetical protein